MIEIDYLAIYLTIGSVAGVLAGLLGIGGGLIIVPSLVWVFARQGVDAGQLVHLAVGTSLATIVATSLSSIWAHHRRNAVRWGLFLQLTPGILLGAWVGAEVADRLSSLWLQRAFGCFAVLVGLRMLLGVKAKARYGLPAWPGMTLGGALIGCVSAVVGIGGGSMTVPFLSACRVHIREAVATSSACGLPIALVGALGFIWIGWSREGLPAGTTGYVYWPAFTGIVVSSVLLAPLGARFAHRMPVAHLKRVFAFFLMIVGVKMLIG